jgi:hypothetical protein
MFVTSERVDVESVMKAVHEEDEEEWGEGVSLADASLKREGAAAAVERSDSGGEACEAARD